MAMHFTATVKKKAVVIRGVDLPDGCVVDVYVDEPIDEGYPLTPEEKAAVAKGRQAIARGEYYDLDDVLAELRGGPKAVFIPVKQAHARAARVRGKRVGARARGTKSTTRRSPSRS